MSPLSSSAKQDHAAALRFLTLRRKGTARNVLTDLEMPLDARPEVLLPTGLEPDRQGFFTSTAFEADRYRRAARAISGQALPAAVLDLDALEANARAMLQRAGHLPVRLCSKSIRCVEVLRRIQALSPRFKGLLCYSGREAAWLAAQGFDDLVVAYPTVDIADLDAVAAQLIHGKRIVLMVDDQAQLEAIAAR